MLNLNLNNVNDRNSNRKDRVMGILSSKLIDSLLHLMRCLTHPVCSTSSHVVVFGLGSKRLAYLPVSATPATPTYWQRQALATARGVRSAG